MKGSVLVLALAAVLIIGLTQAANGDAQYVYQVIFVPPNTVYYSVANLTTGVAVVPVEGVVTGCTALLPTNPPDITPDLDGSGTGQATINPICNPTGGAGSITISVYNPAHTEVLHWTELDFNVTWAGSNSTITLTGRNSWTAQDPQRVPATGTIGLIVLLCLIGGAGLWFVRRKRAAVA
ncbi:MAG: hypothetical protein AB1752_06055 [Candidatus Zixiibacteriota bacterium]